MRITSNGCLEELTKIYLKGCNLVDGLISTWKEKNAAVSQLVVKEKNRILDTVTTTLINGNKLLLAMYLIAQALQVTSSTESHVIAYVSYQRLLMIIDRYGIRHPKLKQPLYIKKLLTTVNLLLMMETRRNYPKD
jgi:hypothetical protein